MEKCRIRDKHPGSATLITNKKNLKVYFYFTIYPVPRNPLQRMIKFLPSALVDPPSTEATQGQGHTNSRLVLKGNIDI
jgi:hypothetical protein